MRLLLYNIHAAISRELHNRLAGNYKLRGQRVRGEVEKRGTSV